MFWLEKNAASIMNFFYYNESFIMLENLITLLEQTYDDVNCEYIAMTKLETFWQRNHEFTSFFSEFLSFIDELNWNKSIKIAVL